MTKSNQLAMTSNELSDRDPITQRVGVLRFLLRVKWTLEIGFTGILLIVLGYFIRGQLEGVMGAFGISLVSICVVGYLVIAYLKCRMKG